MIKMIITGALAAAFFSFSLKADSYAYMAGGDGEFGIVDLNSGVFSQYGNMGQTLGGLAAANGSLYGATYGTASSTLYLINTSSGSLSPIGAASVDYSLVGSTTAGIYAIDSGLNLYSVNPTTGVATYIGPTGLSSSGTWSGLSDGSSTLYLTAGANLYTLNVATGAATLVGGMGGPQVGALVVQGGVLYGGENLPGEQLVTINRTTGAATAGATLTGTSTTIWGLSPAPAPVPEPATVSLFLLGIGFFLILLLRRKTRLAQSRN